MMNLKTLKKIRALNIIPFNKQVIKSKNAHNYQISLKNYLNIRWIELKNALLSTVWTRYSWMCLFHFYHSLKALEKKRISVAVHDSNVFCHLHDYSFLWKIIWHFVYFTIFVLIVWYCICMLSPKYIII